MQLDHVALVCARVQHAAKSGHQKAPTATVHRHGHAVVIGQTTPTAVGRQS